MLQLFMIFSVVGSGLAIYIWWIKSLKKIDKLKEQEKKMVEAFKIYAEITQKEIENLDKQIECFKQNKDYNAEQADVDFVKNQEREKESIEKYFGYVRPAPVNPYLSFCGIENNLYNYHSALNYYYKRD